MVRLTGSWARFTGGSTLYMIVSQTIFSTSSASAAHTSAVTRIGLEPSPLDVILKRIVRLPDTRAPICVRIPS